MVNFRWNVWWKHGHFDQPLQLAFDHGHKSNFSYLRLELFWSLNGINGIKLYFIWSENWLWNTSQKLYKSL